MEIHHQTCQACGSVRMHNIIARETDAAAKIFARCADCKKLVAVYELGLYYHHGKGIESYLRAQGVDAADSGRKWLEKFEAIRAEAVEEYQRVVDRLESDHDHIAGDAE